MEESVYRWRENLEERERDRREKDGGMEREK